MRNIPLEFLVGMARDNTVVDICSLSGDCTIGPLIGVSPEAVLVYNTLNDRKTYIPMITIRDISISDLNMGGDR